MEQLEVKKVEISRTFEAPLELLWKAWTEPEHFMKWYGPKGFTIPKCEIDLRVGGRHLWSMQSPDGKQMYFTGVYKEVVLMERLVFSDAMSDAEGNMISMGKGMPGSMDVTVTFVYENGKTTVTVSHIGTEQAGMGWEQAFDKLAAVLTDS